MALGFYLTNAVVIGMMGGTGATLPLIASPKEFAHVSEMLKTWSLDRLLTMAELFLHRDDRDVAGKPKTIPFFKGQAAWCDERLSGVGR